ncbi:MAG: hypothetical protein ACFFAK_11535 [Promethearchaeota archaeon]
MIVEKNDLELLPDEEVLMELNLSQKIVAKERENMKSTLYLKIYMN